MMNKKTFILRMIFLISIFLISTAYAIEVSYCCEKTVDGAWCQNSPEEKCDDDYRKVPTSCEATSYCRLGCCYDSQEGTCMENTPQKVCNDNGGVWSGESAECDIPQCQLGCCLIGDQAAFVTQTRCKKLSSLYGLEIDFRTDIGSEMECIASATSDVKGACVFEKEFEKTCLFLTKKECQEIETEDSDIKFHDGYLCSNPDFETNCGPSEQTTCVEGRDEVYFIDTCGNLANIYDSSKIKDKEYWTKIYGKAESCSYNNPDGNADNPSCGNCDYYLGSTCKTFKSGEDARPSYGDYICRDLSCEYEDKEYQHGETWCAESKGAEDNLPGSRYFRLVCYNGDVTVEPCADFRQEVCLQSDIEGFKTAACRVNMWQDCASQGSKGDCENSDKRDCKWISDKCVPNYAPGFDFWEAGTDAESLCSLANSICIVKYEKKIGGDRECVENCQCLSSAWKSEMNKKCISLGDCGSKKNYLGY